MCTCLSAFISTSFARAGDRTVNTNTKTYIPGTTKNRQKRIVLISPVVNHIKFQGKGRISVRVLPLCFSVGKIFYFLQQCGLKV